MRDNHRAQTDFNVIFDIDAPWILILQIDIVTDKYVAADTHSPQAMQERAQASAAGQHARHQV